MKVHISKPHILTLSSILLLALTAGVALLTHRVHLRAPNPAPSTKTQLTEGHAQQAAANNTTPGTTQGSAMQATAVDTSAACKLLTLPVAQKALGADVKQITPANTVTLEASNTTVSACAYSSPTTGSVQLVERMPADALGVSKNAVMFGSGKPQNAVAVQGYGQTAYWDPGKHSLDVLGNNNWYIIARSTGTQPDTEAVAKLLVSGF